MASANYSRIEKKRIWLIMSLLVMVGFLSSCVYFRLLDVKGQLANFDENVVVTVDEEGLLLSFNRPTLRLEDLEYLGAVPVERGREEGSRVWRIVMSKRYKGENNEGDRFDLHTTLSFDEGKLASVLIPRDYIERIDPWLYVETIEALGGAKVLKLKKSIAAKADFSPTITREDITQTFGQPFKTKVEDGYHSITYSYRKKVPSGHPDEDRNDKTYSISYVFDENRDFLVATKTRSIRIEYLDNI